jgi:hypothetical protein
MTPTGTPIDGSMRQRELASAVNDEPVTTLALAAADADALTWLAT